MSKVTLKQFLESEKSEVIKDYYGKPLRGLKKEIALRKRKEDKNWKDYDIKDDMVGNAKRVKLDQPIKESQLEQKEASAVWDENKDDASTYEITTKFLIKPSEEKKGFYDVFELTENGKRKFQDSYKEVQIDQLFRPASSTSKADVEGFKEYLLQGTVEAIKWNQDPIEIMTDGVTFTLKKGDYLLRELDGKEFVFTVENRGTFESSPRKKV